MQNTQFSFDGGVLDGYGVLLIDGTSCPAALAEDLERWLRAEEQMSDKSSGAGCQRYW